MALNAVSTQQGPITLYNAPPRFKVVREIMEICGEVLDGLRPCGHPGIFDLNLQYAMLVTATNGAENTFTQNNVGKLKPKDLRMLSNLEQLVHEFHRNVKEAKAELLPG